MADRVGQQLGNYRLVALLGQGGYADVYLGQHVRLPLHVAIKVLHSHLTGQEAEHFQQEAETIARLMHPSIVRILDYDVQAGVPFLVMDYTPNGSLRRRYPKGTVVPLPQIVSHVKQIAAALHYAHEQKFIHRDVKPENMLLGRYEEVLLSDFGLATLAHSSASLSTQEAMGTLAYMAPEQIEGHPRVASDQYALGVVVYEWLCGSRPFEGSFSEVMVQHLSLPPPPLRERVPTIPGEVEQIVLKALAKDARQRFVRVKDFALALEVASTAASTGSTRLMLASGYPSEAQYSTKHHLPAYLTTLLGREQEVVATCAFLRRLDVRLVTLTGTGGIGKTRLALQVATELLADFAEGVYFVSLAPISDPNLVISTIAQTLEVKESGTRPLMDLLKAFLKDKHVLLILDNFEQIILVAPSLAELLAICPHLKLLVTSRAVLHVQGEQEFPVPPLAVPDLAHLPEREALVEYAAVALFLQRAQAIKPDFQLTKVNARTVAAICARLDGLPLAIELAAARIKLLPPQALLTRLEHRLAVLTGGAQNLPARQQTLRKTIAWSYQLLDAQEQRLFLRLSVFVGGCTLEAIEAVCAALDKSNGAGGVMDGVASLIDKSLLQQREQEREEPRLVMLETIREYGVEALGASGELEMTRQAHAEFYLGLAEEVEPELRGAQQSLWLERLEREYENLRAALSWLTEQNEAEQALRLAGALWYFWYLHGDWGEGRRSLEAALGLPSAQGPAVERAKALYSAGELAYWQVDYSAARRLLDESIALYRALGDIRGLVYPLGRLGVLLQLQGNFALGDSLAEESITLCRTLGNTWVLCNLLPHLGWAAVQNGDYTKAGGILLEGLTLARELGDKSLIAAALHVNALLTFIQGYPAQAAILIQEGLAIARGLGDKVHIANAVDLLGSIALSLNDLSQAKVLFTEGFSLGQELGDKYIVVWHLTGLARVAAAEGQPHRAAHLFAAAEVLLDPRNMLLSPFGRADYEQAVATTRAQLGEKAFATAWAEGRMMTPEQALAAETQVMKPSSGEPAASPSAKSPLTYPDGLMAREVEVLRLVAQGLTNEQVAEQLVISPRTVNTHLTSIYGKIQVSSRAAATRYAIEHQFV